MRRFIVSVGFLTPSVFASSAGAGFDIMQFAPILLIFAIFYFLILRPQQKKARAHQEMVKGLSRGDKVLTAGGIIGSVDKVLSDTELSIEIADGVKVRVLKNTVTDMMAKPQPTSEKSASVKKESTASIAEEVVEKKTVTKTKKTDAASTKKSTAKKTK